MKLYIDTANSKTTLIKIDDRVYEFTYVSPRDQNVLKAVTDAMSAEHKDLVDLTEIEVNVGPGSFNGLRVGISVASALSFALSIPINGQPAGTSIVPFYGAEPSITKKI